MVEFQANRKWGIILIILLIKEWQELKEFQNLLENMEDMEFKKNKIKKIVLVQGNLDRDQSKVLDQYNLLNKVLEVMEEVQSNRILFNNLLLRLLLDFKNMDWEAEVFQENLLEDWVRLECNQLILFLKMTMKMVLQVFMEVKANQRNYHKNLEVED